MKLIFIHGSGGSKDFWKQQTEYFKDSEALNLPGHPDGEPYETIEECVEWLREYVTDRGYRDLVIAGHSLGGGIALLYGLKYPEEVKGLITVGSGGRLRVLPKILEDLEKTIADPENYPRSREKPSDLISPEMAEIMKRAFEENGPATSLADFRACDRFDIMDRLGEINIPLLAVCGSEDVMTPPKYSHYMTDNMPNARTIIIPGGSHLIYVEKPVEVNQAIAEFLKEI
jgi:pimeloyl-ACP methyl ester carboxylesterase